MKKISKWIEDNLSPLGILGSEFRLITNDYDGNIIKGVIFADNGKKFPFIMMDNMIYHEKNPAKIIMEVNKNRTDEQQDKEMEKINDDVNWYFENENKLIEKLFIDGYHLLKDRGIEALKDKISKEEWEIYKNKNEA